MPRRRTPLFYLIPLVIGLLILALGSQTTLEMKARGLLWGIMRPVHKVIIFFGDEIGRAWRTYVDLSHIADDNQALNEEVDRLKSEVLFLKRFQEEAGRLRNLLNIRGELPYQLVAGRIIGKDASLWSGTVIFDVGKNRGLIPGLGVITPNGVVGQVVEVFPRSSRVMLITDASSRLDAYVERTSDSGILEGKTAKLCRLKYLPAAADLQVGDRILTGGEDGIFPRGLPIGTVSMVSKERFSLLQEVEVNPFASVEGLQEVLVILSGPGGQDAGAR